MCHIKKIVEEEHQRSQALCQKYKVDTYYLTI